MRNGDTMYCVSARPLAAACAGLAAAMGLWLATPEQTMLSAANASGMASGPLLERHAGAARNHATPLPRSEGDQAVVDGWPLYRTERGQASFNAAMATLAATAGTPAPSAAVFKKCPELQCNLTLPAIGADGWLPAGRLWLSDKDYLVIAHSPRTYKRRAERRHAFRSMRYFVLHEFHNGSRNTDTHDTISSHSGSVFVPLYMSKQATDVEGRRFVVVMQVAPYDVVSIHASDKGSAGPGIEVAKNVTDTLEPLQSLAGIVISSMIKTAAPHLRVVNHRGTEGLPMLRAYEQRLQGLRNQAGEPPVVLPFVAASATKVAAATGHIDDLILRPGASPRIPVAKRGIVPSRAVASVEPVLVKPRPVQIAALTPAPVEAEVPILVSGPTLARRPAKPEPQLVSAPTRVSPAMCLSTGVAKFSPCIESSSEKQ